MALDENENQLLINWNEIGGSRNWENIWQGLISMRKTNNNLTLPFPPILLSRKMGSFVIHLYVAYSSGLWLCGYLPDTLQCNRHCPNPFQLNIWLKLKVGEISIEKTNFTSVDFYKGNWRRWPKLIKICNDQIVDSSWQLPSAKIKFRL